MEETFTIFEESDFWLDLSSVTIGPEIGEGQFSKVYLGKYFGDYVAVKKQTREDKGLDNYLLRELSVLKNASHQNLVSYIGACNVVVNDSSQMNALYIVTEFCQGGDLLGLLISDQDLGWKFRIKIALEAAAAIKYLHRRHLIHRDIKSSNILLDHNWSCKLSDFGMAREFNEMDSSALLGEKTRNRRMTICGTNEYMAPELLFDEEYSSSVDIFSFGIVLLEILGRKRAGVDNFAVRRPQSNFVLDCEAIQAELPDSAPPSLIMLALQCTEYDISNRPLADDVYDWLCDLHDSTAEDTIPRPQLKPITQIPDSPHFQQPSLPPSTSTADETPKQPPLTEKSLREMYALNESGANTILKSGYIFKRNKTGFRNWKSRWLVLTPLQLRWYANMNDRVEKGHIELLDAKVKQTKQYRFVVLDVEDFLQLESDSSNYHREFSAEGSESMEDWINAIQLAIDNYRRLRTASRVSVAAPCGSNSLYVAPGMNFFKQDRSEKTDENINRPSIDDTPNLVASVGEWLSNIGLSNYTDKFHSSGYDNMQLINEFGITNDDLAYMGITHPLHRRALKVAAVSEYSHAVLAAITEWQEIGSVVVYRVISRWRFSRACVLMQFGDFKKLHSNILKLLSESDPSNLLNKLPELPGGDSICCLFLTCVGKGQLIIQSRNPLFLNQRRIALESYLLTLSSLISGTSLMSPLLETLGLSPRTIPEKIEVQRKIKKQDFSSE